VSSDSHRGSSPAGVELGRVRAVAGGLVALVVMLQQPATEFRGDAYGYWIGATAIANGDRMFELDLLELRGVVTTFIYVPAAIVEKLMGRSIAGFAVLAQNAILIAVVGVWLLPRLVGIWRTVTPRDIWICGLAAATLLRGFAPVPLTDLWAAALLLSAVALVDGTATRHLVLSGLAAGLAFNVRPATVIGVIGLSAVVLIARRGRTAWFGGGIALALLPQLALNGWRGASLVPWPERTSELIELQTGYAAYIVRYDTIAAETSSLPRRFYCSPGMADALQGDTPASITELATAFAAHPAQALVLSAQKVAAALHWPLATPYTSGARGANMLFALLVTSTAVVGAAVILRTAIRRGRSGLSVSQVATVVIWSGSVLALVTSAAESRFALPVVLIGVVGLSLILGQGLRVPVERTRRRWVLGTLASVAAVFAIGVSGLQHPHSGKTSLADCAEVSRPSASGQAVEVSAAVEAVE
jgi:hypothetical protein